MGILRAAFNLKQTATFGAAIKCVYLWRMMRRPRFSRFFAIAISIFFGGLISTSIAETLASGPRMNGTRFTIAASIKADPQSAKYAQGGEASLAVNLRISAHAVDSEFYGIVSRNFSTSLNGESGEQVYWQDKVCHQKRGYPKTTVTSIDGTITIHDHQPTRVQARARHIGLQLPVDEITSGIKMPAGVSKKGRFIVYRSVSKQSHFIVDVKTYIEDCEFTPGEWRFHTPNAPQN